LAEGSNPSPAIILKTYNLKLEARVSIYL